MGALAPISHWLPQDDLLLKNAVEAGASLEALAKGAVRFSQRFTVQELRDRWYSLLYDPIISAEASVHMIEFERSASTAKFNNQAKCISGKRKADSVRKCYYAMCKRICSEPLDSTGISFLGGSGFTNAGKKNEPLSADCFFGYEEVSDLLGVQESNFGTMAHAFPELQATGAGSSSDGVSAGAFCTRLCDNGDENLVKEFDQSKELQTYDLFETVDVESSPIFEEINCEQGNEHSGLESKTYNSPPSDSGASLPDFHCSSPIPQMLNWSAIECLVPSTLADVIGETEDHAENDHVTPDANVLGYNSLNSNPELKGQRPCAAMKDTLQNAEEYFAELSNSLLNFSPEDDLLFVDADGKDMIDKSYIENLSSLLLDSPDKGCTSDLGISEVTVAAHVCLSSSPSAARPGESDGQGHYHCDDQHVVQGVEAQKLSSALTVNPSFPELRNGVIFCTLNTEDPEIPNNDDVFLPICLSSMSISSINHSEFDESYYPMLSSAKQFSYTQTSTDAVLTMSEQSNYSQLHVPSQMTISSFQMGASCQIDDLQPKGEPLHNDQQHMTLREVNCKDPTLVNSGYSGNRSLVLRSGEQLLAKIEQPNHFLSHNSFDSHIQKQAEASDPYLRFQKNAACSKQDIESSSNIQNHEGIHAEFCSVEKTAAEAITIPIVSDQEELSCGSDDEVPYFSDVEAMILDMDLSPDDQDSNCSPGVLKYQHGYARRTIIRLEQAADSSLQRMLSAQGAFAVLYGRRSKHFIKKTEVLLGRATEDVKVDIDLGMECHANRISRRQATIKMDPNGSFHLTNHGKISIFVNSKEVVPWETVDLVSGCLIEVRGLPFIFETKRRRIKQSPHKPGNESQSWDLKD